MSPLDWSDKQRRILTSDGKAADYYSPHRGFAFTEDELPHYLLSRSSCRETFREWSVASLHSQTQPLIVGAWKRPLFYGGWEHSTDQEETVFNVQTNTMFVDLRLPVDRLSLETLDSTTNKVNGLEDLSPQQLRLYARQHCFAGFTRTEHVDNNMECAAKTEAFQQVCTRHHCVDWNFVGNPRNRPNKWWVETPLSKAEGRDKDTTDRASSKKIFKWKEWAYATNESGQHYYCERWERLPSERNQNVVLAFQKQTGQEGVLVVAHDHFNYCCNRRPEHPHTNQASLTNVVDDCVEKGDLTTARQWLSIQGGHGRISQGWKIDAALEFWRQGTSLWTRDTVRLERNPSSSNSEGNWRDSCVLYWDEEAWEILECNFASFADLNGFLMSSLPE